MEEHRIRRRIRCVQRILSVILITCLGYLIFYQWDSYKQEKQNIKLQNIAGVDVDVSTSSPVLATEKAADTDTASEFHAADVVYSAAPGDTPVETSTGCLPGYETLLEINPQIRGWIFVPDTMISFPLLQGTDNDYYLNHDIYGQENRYGSIFVDCKADLYGGSPNIIIYGHHMRNGGMFGALKYYKKESFYKSHPSFFLFLPEEEREYEIIAVLNNDIFSGAQDTFRYYDYARIENEEVFAEYCRSIRERALYDTGMAAAFGDELITLCTCDYGSKEQRLLVVGRRL